MTSKEQFVENYRDGVITEINTGKFRYYNWRKSRFSCSVRVDAENSLSKIKQLADSVIKSGDLRREEY